MGGTWDLDPDDFSFGFFSMDFKWDVYMRTGPPGPSPLECLSFPPLTTVVLITPKGLSRQVVTVVV